MSKRSEKGIDVGGSDHPVPILGRLAGRHPEKVAQLSHVFRDTTTSYKLFWFRSLLGHVRTGWTEQLTVRSVLDEMVVQAWCPVFTHRLSLGVQDRLQGIVHDLGSTCGLQRTAATHEVRAALAASPQLRPRIDAIGRYVPTRFLAPWYASALHGRTDSTKDGAIRTLGRQRGRSAGAPYTLGPDPRARTVRLDRRWLEFMTENLGVISDFGDFHLARYLQDRNPAVPGILQKLDPRLRRDTSPGRAFWNEAIRAIGSAGAKGRLLDVYSERWIERCESIDHFLPWSFVAHDQRWNLVPVEPSTNSTKGDAIPDLDLYLPRLAMAHHAAIQVLLSQPRLLEDHVQFFGLGVKGLAETRTSDFIAMYRSRLAPQAQIAANQGFPSAWRYPSARAREADGGR